MNSRTPYLVDEAITGRASIRAFTSQAVDKNIIQDILRVASWAPSGSNIQPWRVYVLQGASRDALVQKVCDAHDAVQANPELDAEYQPEYQYYPVKWFNPYLERRRENGFGLYAVLGIQKGDRARMHAQHQKNFTFFGAPVGLIFTVHRELEQGSLMDYGMFLQNIMVAAKARGLDTCPQAAWNRYAKIILPHVGASSEEMLVCGMALGYADETDVVNEFRATRLTPERFTTWLT